MKESPIPPTTAAAATSAAATTTTPYAIPPPKRAPISYKAQAQVTYDPPKLATPLINA